MLPRIPWQLFAWRWSKERTGSSWMPSLARMASVVVIHDSTVDRTTDGSGKVAELTFAELQQLDAGIQFAPRFAGEKVPSLEQVLDDLGDKTLINIELTSYASPGDDLPEKAAALVKKAGMEKNMIFSSFPSLSFGTHPIIDARCPSGTAYWGRLDGSGEILSWEGVFLPI